MVPNTMTTAPCAPWAIHSQTVAALSYRLRLEAGNLEGLRVRMAAVAQLEWESPAGRNFRSYVASRGQELLRACSSLQEAAHQLDVHSEVLRRAELADFLGKQL